MPLMGRGGVGLALSVRFADSSNQNAPGPSRVDSSRVDPRWSCLESGLDDQRVRGKAPCDLGLDPPGSTRVGELWPLADRQPRLAAGRPRAAWRRRAARAEPSAVELAASVASAFRPSRCGSQSRKASVALPISTRMT